MRCNCEVASSLNHDHDPADCQRQAFVKERWLGGVCLECAPAYAEHGSLIPLSDVEGSYTFDEGTSVFLEDLISSQGLQKLMNGELMLISSGGTILDDTNRERYLVDPDGTLRDEDGNIEGMDP